MITTNRLYPLTLNIVARSLMMKKEDTNWFWHYRYDHLPFKGLKTLSSKKMVIELPDITPPTEICESCVVAKHKRNSFPSGKSRRARAIWSWFIQTYVVWSLPHQMITRYVYWHKHSFIVIQSSLLRENSTKFLCYQHINSVLGKKETTPIRTISSA